MHIIYVGCQGSGDYDELMIVQKVNFTYHLILKVFDRLIGFYLGQSGMEAACSMKAENSTTAEEVSRFQKSLP